MINTSRKLVTIKRIDSISPIQNADLIEVVKIGGWKVVVKKTDNFNPGDLVVYGEIDSVFPVNNPDFAFLKGERLRTKKLRGVISQGIVFPLRILGETQVHEGDDVTEQLGVIKYNPPESQSLDSKGIFPIFIPKTDVERVQNLQVELIENQNSNIIIQEKLDGSSITIFAGFYPKQTELEKGICSKNLELKLECQNKYVSTGLPYLNKLASYCLKNNLSIALQGELVGEGIQKNKYKIIGQQIYFFQAFNIQLGTFLPTENFTNLCIELDLPVVAIVGKADTISTDIDEWLTLAEDKSKLNPASEREGIVIRTIDNSFIFKAISNKFLLKSE